MSPIGYMLLSKCNNDMSIDLKKATLFLPGINVQRIKAVAIMIGITINK